MTATLGDDVARLVLVIVLAGFVLYLIAECSAYGRARWHDHEARTRRARLIREINRHQEAE